MLKRYFLLLTMLLPALCSLAQSPQYAFRVYFNNKAATQFTLNNPVEFLSQRAIDRRLKYNITVDSSDLPVNAAYIDSVLEKTDGTLHSCSRWNNAIVILLNDSSAIHQIDTLPFFEGAQLVGFYATGLSRPLSIDDSTLGQKPTDFDQNFYAAAWTQIHLCHGEFLHQNGKAGAGVLIALIDAGFEGVSTAAAFDTLLQDNRLADRWNFVHDTLLRQDEGGHGTKTFSCIAGYLPGVYVGTAPEASFALYTSEDLDSEQPIEEDNWTAAAERADSIGSDLISTSVGYNTFDSPFSDYVYSDLDGHSTYIARAVNTASAKGIVVVASAGNEGTSPWQHILTPGDADSALTIGSVNAQKIPASSTGLGPNASGRTKPDVAGLGVGTAVVTPSGSIENNSGTSFSTPVIAGLTACLLQAAPDNSPGIIRQIIRSVSDHFNNPDNVTGYGIPDFQAAYNLITSVSELMPPEKNRIRIYPNPARNQLNILLPYPTPVTLTILDNLGRIKKQQSFDQPQRSLDLNIHDLSAGIYFLKIKSDSGYTMKKLIRE
jgi:hypothetical protein